MKLDKIEKEMQKTREKIAVLQNHLKELDGQRIEQENMQIVQLVRGMHMTRDELTVFLNGGASTAPIAPAPDTGAGRTYSNYATESEDKEDE